MFHKFVQLVGNPLVQIASVLAVALKLIEQATTFLKNASKDRKIGRIREEIYSLQSIRAGAPAVLHTLIDNRLQVLYQDYRKLSLERPEPELVYPKTPRWRQLLLFYLPARKWALMPQLL